MAAVGQRIEPGERIVFETLLAAEMRKRLTAGGFFDGKTIAVLGTCFAGSGFSIDMTDR